MNDIIVFVFEYTANGFDLTTEFLRNLHEYLNEKSSKTVKIVPIIGEKMSFYCVYPTMPSDEILSLLTKVSEYPDDEIANESKRILRLLKLMKFIK